MFSPLIYEFTVYDKRNASLSEGCGVIPVALSKDLRPNAVMPVHIAGVDVAVWRQSTGQVNAVKNQCPHRGVRLSLGFVRNDYLTCRYHGWAFDAEAACLEMPSMPGVKPPKAVCAQKFVVLEQFGLIWVSLEDTGKTVFEAMPTERVAKPVRTIYLDAPLDMVGAYLCGPSIPNLDGHPLMFTQIATQPEAALFLLEAEHNTYPLAVLMHAVTAKETAVHVVQFLEESATQAAVDWALDIRTLFRLDAAV